MSPKFRASHAFFIVIAALLVPSLGSAQTAGPPPSCTTMPEMRQFDFWIGEWDVNPWQQPTAPPASMGKNSVHSIIDGCAVLEEWTGSKGGIGKSLNFYDLNRKAWRQVWVGTGGGSLDYSGDFHDNAMHFEGWSAGKDGKHTLQKLTFTKISADTVRQTFEASTDDGKTWNVTFDGRYVRHR